MRGGRRVPLFINGTLSFRMKIAINDYSDYGDFINEYNLILEQFIKYGFKSIHTNKITLYLSWTNKKGKIIYPTQYGTCLEYIYKINRSHKNNERSIEIYRQFIRNPDTFKITIKGVQINSDEIEYVLHDIEKQISEQNDLKIGSVTGYMVFRDKAYGIITPEQESLITGE